MKTSEVKVNRLNMDNRNHLSFENENASAPFVSCNNKELESYLDLYAGPMISVRYNSYTGYEAKDLKKYSKRLSNLSPRYVFGGFKNLVIDGYVMEHIMVGILSKIS